MTKKIESIETSEWKPTHEALEYPEDFVEWIDSINSGWKKRKKYKPFRKYCEQAYRWIDLNDTYEKCKTGEERFEFLLREDERCRQNTLYGVMKYGWVNEYDHETEENMRFVPWEVQEVILFLEDAGYSFMVVKGRQIGFTTVEGLATAIQINFRKSMFIKFIACDVDKTEEIFDYKIKWPFSQIDRRVKATVGGFSKRAIKLYKKKAKGEIGGRNSSVLVDNPKKDAINGGSPSKVKMDEIGLIDEIFGDIMREGRPTLFYLDKKTKKLKMKRQLIAWGTGGEMDRGGAVLEDEFMTLMQEWKSRKFTSGIIPIFLDAFAREGITQEFIDNERRKAYATQGTQRAKAIATFHQHYPIVVEDVFIRNERTMLPHDKINKMLTYIWRLKGDNAPVFGRFEPVYDMSTPYPAGFKIPYKIIGATFVQTEDMGDPRTTCCMWMPPEEGWVDRYYSGVDPINSDTGHSFFSAGVWDDLLNTLSCSVFYRELDYEMCYLQSILMNLYYDTFNKVKVGIPEVIENNIGDQYVKFREMLQLESVIVPTKQLHPSLQGNSPKWWGISKKANTAGAIIFEMQGLLDKWHKRIMIPRIWIGLKKFIEKDMSKQSNQLRDTRWAVANRKSDRDDDLDSMTYAYICARAHDHLKPRNINDVDIKPLKRKKVVIISDQTNFEGVSTTQIENGRVRNPIKRFSQYEN